MPAVTDSDTGQSAKRRRGNSWWIATSVLLIVAIVVGILELLPANYYMLLPGQAQDVSAMIDVKGYPPVHARGHLYMTDVSVYKVDHLLEYIYGRLNPDAELDKAQSFSGGLSESQLNVVNHQLMLDSTQQAQMAALSAVSGYKARFKNLGPAIVGLVPETPASRVLQGGDIIEAVDGTSVKTVPDVAPLVRLHVPGSIVALTVKRKHRVIHVKVKTIASTRGRPNQKGKTALIGVSLQDQLFVEPLPVTIRIKFGDIGGPSAGLMFTLGIIQRLEKRDITNGCSVAGTGTIDYKGNVGAIGGARQKILAARQAGARYFLVPDVPEDVQPARQYRGDIRVVPLKSLRQALRFLRSLPRCR